MQEINFITMILLLQFQSNAYALFLGCFDKDVREKLRGTSPMFINNLHTLLLATNPFVLTVMQ